MLKNLILSLLSLSFMASSALATGQKLSQEEAQKFLIETFNEGSRSTQDGCEIKVQKDSSGFIFEIYRGTDFPFVFLFDQEYSDVPFYLVTAGSTSALTQDFSDSFMYLRVTRRTEGTQVEIREDIAGETRTITCTL